jgi:hypothetical protein
MAAKQVAPQTVTSKVSTGAFKSLYQARPRTVAFSKKKRSPISRKFQTSRLRSHQTRNCLLLTEASQSRWLPNRSHPKPSRRHVLGQYRRVQKNVPGTSANHCIFQTSPAPQHAKALHLCGQWAPKSAVHDPNGLFERLGRTAHQDPRIKMTAKQVAPQTLIGKEGAAL